MDNLVFYFNDYREKFLKDIDYLRNYRSERPNYPVVKGVSRPSLPAERERDNLSDGKGFDNRKHYIGNKIYKRRK